MTEIDGYLDQILIEEFHEAGIWLPEEIEARERQLTLEKRQREMFAALMKQQAGMTTIPTMIAGHFGQQGLGLLGQQQSALGGGLAPLLGGLFGGLR